jgi:hypothetical protein
MILAPGEEGIKDMILETEMCCPFNLLKGVLVDEVILLLNNRK